MTKAVFMRTLSDRLVSVTPERIAPTDAVRSLDYYEEMIDDRMEDGMSEEEAVAAVGHPDDVFRAILAALPQFPASAERQPEPVPQPVPPTREKKSSPWKTVLLIVSSPVWVPLLIAAAAILFSLYIALFAVVVSFWGVFVSLAASGAILIASSIPLFIGEGMPAGMASLGLGLASAGLAILFFFLCTAFTRLSARLTEVTFRGAISLFDRKEPKS